MNDVMVDLETLGKNAGCTILSIGAVMFDQKTGELGDEFYVVINRESCAKHGLEEDASTVEWWNLQSAEARTVLTHAETSAVNLPEALRRFELWLLHTQAAPFAAEQDFAVMRKGLDSVKFWGNGADFDNAILQTAYKAVGAKEAPWKFWNNRCYRTLKGQYPEVRLTRKGTHHNALDDAKTQAWHAIELLRYQESFRALSLRVLNRKPWYKRIFSWV